MVDNEKKMTNEEKARLLFESGIVKYRDSEATMEEKKEAVNLILEAANLGNADALYVVGTMTIAGRITLKNENPMEHALNLLRRSASMGNMNARCVLNQYCENRDKEREIEKNRFGTEISFSEKVFWRKTKWTSLLVTGEIRELLFAE